MTIVYVCYTCQDYNKHHLGEPDFEFKESEIADSLSMAMKHINEGHYVTTEIRDYESDKED